jgi:thiol-disulfide isomerase/thioredoxin
MDFAMDGTRFDQFTKFLAKRQSSRRTAIVQDNAGPTSQPAARSGRPDALAGELAPGFALADIGGRNVTLEALLAPGKPLLLVFAEPRCGPCYELLPDLGGWQRVYGDRLSIALISSGEARTNLAMTADYGIRSVLLQREREAETAYGLAMAPAAILVQPDGRIGAGPRYGTRAIRRLVAETLGLAVPPDPVRDTRIAELGESVPPFRLPDLAGNVVDLAAWRGAPTLLLFWSPGCSHCANLLPEVLACERQPNRPRIVVVSRGPIGLNQDLGFASPVVLDDARMIGDGLGVAGTPAAVLIDAMGKVAAPVGRGGAGVRALMARTRIPATTAADQGLAGRFGRTSP